LPARHGSRAQDREEELRRVPLEVSPSYRELFDRDLQSVLAREDWRIVPLKRRARARRRNEAAQLEPTSKELALPSNVSFQAWPLLEGLAQADHKGLLTMISPPVLLRIGVFLGLHAGILLGLLAFL
jgi:hypothetical protein